MSYCPPMKPVVLSEKATLIKQLKSQVKLDRETDTEMTSDRLGRILALSKLCGDPIEPHMTYDPVYGTELVSDAVVKAVDIWIGVE